MMKKNQDPEPPADGCSMYDSAATGQASSRSARLRRDIVRNENVSPKLDCSFSSSNSEQGPESETEPDMVAGAAAVVAEASEDGGSTFVQGYGGGGGGGGEGRRRRALSKEGSKTSMSTSNKDGGGAAFASEKYGSGPEPLYTSSRGNMGSLPPQPDMRYIRLYVLIFFFFRFFVFLALSTTVFFFSH